jgi:GNAT superfamily N-acetyltransferase
MDKITYTDFENGDISNLRNLCNDLMKFQADHAKIKPEVMASMNFENRLLPDFSHASRKYIAVAYDEDTPVGFAFASVSEVTEADINTKPIWAKDIDGVGFYPDDYGVPTIIGTYKLLFVNPNYRSLNIGRNLSQMIMKWLNSHGDIKDLWVFVANGNEKVAKFYEKYGFTHSHSVFNGFIEAYTQKAIR